MRPVLSTDMKEQNRRLVYRYIHGKPGQSVTRTEISRQTGISGPTVLKIFDFFEKRGLIVPDGAEDSQEPGRKSSVFRFAPDAAYAVGASYDGRFLELSLVNLNFDTVRHVRTELDTDVSALIGEVLPAQLTAFTAGIPRLMGIGISLPAAVDNRKKRIRYQAFPALDTRMSKENLEDECQKLEQMFRAPVLLENDVNCAAVAEFRTLELGDKDDLIYIVLGGGIGAGLVLGGKLRRGQNFSCGEIGYMVWDPAFSARGGSGCLEWELYRRTQELFGADLLDECGGSIPEAAVEHVAGQLALAVANLANALDVSRFALGGRVSERLEPGLIQGINAHLHALCMHRVMVSASQCPDACPRGAASLLIVRELDSLLSDRQ